MSGGGSNLREVVATLDRRCSGRLGLAAVHLDTGEQVRWRDRERFRTASTAKVAIHAAAIGAAKAARLDLCRRVALEPRHMVGSSGVLDLMHPGLAPTVADLCTLMIVVSDNTATNLMIDLLGGVEAVNAEIASLGFSEIRLERKLAYPPAPLVAGRRPRPAPVRTFATATPDSLCRLVSALAAGEVADRDLSATVVRTMDHQQDRTLIPRRWAALSEPGDDEGMLPRLASKTGCIPGCRAEIGLLRFPGGGRVAFAAMVDDLTDLGMTPLSEGERVLGRLGEALLYSWWSAPAPVPVVGEDML